MLREAWSGEEWQKHCRALLAQRYGADVQFIPDRDRGDGGLEAYLLTDGVAYQCYAPQDAYDVRSLTEAQKAKIRTDIKKLVDDPARTQRLIGTGRLLRRWVLLTPSCDSKDVVIYARDKSAKVRAHPRPVWCDQDFEVSVHSDELFSAERATLYGHVVRLALDVDDPSVNELEDALGAVGLRLRDKLQADAELGADTILLQAYRDELLLDFVRGKKQISILENQYTATYAAVRRRAGATLRALTRVTLGSTATSGAEMVEALTQRLAGDIAASSPGLSSELCEELARCYVATWFIDCPLRFRAPAA